jgi:hypothetical protein
MASKAVNITLVKVALFDRKIKCFEADWLIGASITLKKLPKSYF